MDTWQLNFFVIMMIFLLRQISVCVCVCVGLGQGSGY